MRAQHVPDVRIARRVRIDRERRKRILRHADERIVPRVAVVLRVGRELRIRWQPRARRFKRRRRRRNESIAQRAAHRSATKRGPLHVRLAYARADRSGLHPLRQNRKRRQRHHAVLDPRARQDPARHRNRLRTRLRRSRCTTQRQRPIRWRRRLPWRRPPRLREQRKILRWRADVRRNRQSPRGHRLRLPLGLQVRRLLARRRCGRRQHQRRLNRHKQFTRGHQCAQVHIRFRPGPFRRHRRGRRSAQRRITAKHAAASPPTTK